MNVALLGTCVVLGIVHFLAALPWAWALGLIPRGRLSRGKFWLTGLAAAAGVGGALGFYLNNNNDPKVLSHWGRFLFSLLHFQVGLDLFVAAFGFMLAFWPKGGAVALASFQEGVRQPKFWLLLVIGIFAMGISTILPFFTFGEDIKVVRELCFVLTMILPGVFGVLAASISVAEEIEGRTAVTLMSKPIQRRDFLLGKFAGISLAALSMTIALGWLLVWIVLYKDYLDPPLAQQEPPDPTWIANLRAGLGGGSVGDLARGMAFWINDAGDALPGLVIGFCQVLVLTAFAVALATRVPMLVNIVACMVIYFLGHLTTILTDVTQTLNPLIHFLAQSFDTVLPGLDAFDVGPAIIRDMPLPFLQYSAYAGHVTLYGLAYTAIALLLGLILFEDRDLA